MDDDARLQELVEALRRWRAGQGTQYDFNDPQWFATLRREGPPRLYQQYGPIYPTVQELCGLYARATPERQAAVRATIAQHHDALQACRQFTPSLAPAGRCSYEEWQQGRADFKEQDFDDWLRLLIAALALQLARIDYRDDILAVGHLAHEARQRGIDFAPYQQELIRLSDSASIARLGLPGHR